MRLARLVVAVVVVLCSLAVAAPSPNQKERAKLVELDKQILDHQIKQAVFAAAKAAKQAVDIATQVYGDEAPETARRMTTLAGLLQQTGDYPGAIALYKKLLALAEKQHGPDSRQALHALSPMIGALWSLSAFDEVEPIANRMLALTKKLDGANSLMYATQLQTYGGLLLTRNQYSSAQRVYAEALKVHEAIAKGPDDLALLGPLQMMGNIYVQTNQWPKALAIYDRVIAIVENHKDATVMTKAGTLWGVASMYHYGGREDLAAPLRKKVVDHYTAEVQRLEKANPDDPMLASMLGQLGYTYRQANDIPNADKFLSRAVALDEKKLGFSGWSGTLAEIKRAQGKPKEALVLLERAAAALVKVSPTSGTAYNTMIADVLRETGDVARAEKLVVEHLASVAKQHGKRHPVYGVTQLSAAFTYMAAGKLDKAEQMLTESLEASERELQVVLKSGTEADHAIYFSKNTYQLDTAINFHRDYAKTRPSAARLAMTTALRRKGRVLDAAAANLATIRAKLSPEDKKLLDDLAAARAQLATLTVAGPSATGGADYAKAVAALEDQIQKLEVTVGKKSAAYRAVAQAIELAPVQRAIPKDARLVEIVNFLPVDPTAPYRIIRIDPPRRYAAIVLGPKGDPRVVDLGEAQAIDDLVTKLRKSLSDPNDANAATHGRALYDLTIAKLLPALGGATEILIAPDGALNVVPFSALVDDKGAFLVQRFNFTYLTSGRDLLRLKVKTKAQGGGVLFADPAFDGTKAPAKSSEPATRGRRSIDLASLEWPPLPGTAAEATEVEKKLAGLTVYRGAKATETAVKQVHGPKILHLATHGFFLPDPKPKKLDPTRAAPAMAPGTPPPPVAENPLLRSGLAFAGANQLTSGDDDGILTALEASTLDLQGTKLVVLSACETGVGKVTNGEGVYGLRRALVIAGAESLVMSLWQVDDNATKELMSGYYAELAKGKPRSSALRAIQLQLLAKKAYAHPFYWASFLPAGDNSPLDR